MSDRKNWFFGQRVTQAELDESYDELEAADRAVVADILGYGFFISVTNPATVEEAAVPDLTVVVNALLGYDQDGRRLSNARSGYQNATDLGTSPQSVSIAVDEVSASTAVATPGNEKIISVFIEFARHLQDPRTDDNSATVYFDVDESIQFNIVQSAEAGAGLAVPPPLRSDQLLLCDITLTEGMTAIEDADIDQSRRQAFVFSLLHGDSHATDGADPIPVATGSVGGLMAAADYTKLAGITFTGAGVGALFNCQAAPFQPANITAPATTSMDVTSRFAGKAAGGAAAKEGIATQTSAPNNRADLLNDDMDEFVDAAGNKVYGRVTVDNETTPTAWTLTFYSFDETTGETIYDMTPYAGQTIVWYVRETFRLHNLPVFSAFNIPSDQVAAEVVSATEAVAGKVMFVADGIATALKAVQGSDSRLTGVAVKKNSAAAVGTRRVINFIEGTSITLTVVDDGTDIDVTIAAAAGVSAISTAFGTDTNASSPFDVATSTFTPKIAIVFAGDFIDAGGNTGSIGMGIGTGAGQQAALAFGLAPGASVLSTGKIIDGTSGSGAIWALSQFDTTRVRATASVNTSPPDIAMLVLGSS